MALWHCCLSTWCSPDIPLATITISRCHATYNVFLLCEEPMNPSNHSCFGSTLSLSSRVRPCQCAGLYPTEIPTMKPNRRIPLSCSESFVSYVPIPTRRQDGKQVCEASVSRMQCVYSTLFGTHASCQASHGTPRSDRSSSRSFGTSYLFQRKYAETAGSVPMQASRKLAISSQTSACNLALLPTVQHERRSQFRRNRIASHAHLLVIR